MHSNLTPEKRLDKNGRLVTKHVLPPSSPNSKPLTIPKIFKAKADMGIMGKWGEADNNTVTDMLKALRPEELYQLRDIMMTCDERSKEQLQKIILTKSYRAAQEKSPTLDAEIQRAALLLPLLNTLKADQGGHSIGNSTSVASYVHDLLGDRVPEKLLSGTEQEQNLAKGLVMTIEAGYSESPPFDDMQWVGDNSEALLPHFNRMKELSYFDREFCESLLATESPSISSGIL